MTPLLTPPPDHVQPLPPRGIWPAQAHVFDARSIHAVNAALASRRPLLLRGEPGIGKSQLARAVACRLGRPYLELVVDARTEARDLLWTYDAVARLADAQIASALGRSPDDLKVSLAVGNYVRPGPLWFALNWQAALAQLDRIREPRPSGDPAADPKRGCVLLIDELDKAESEVPNGLLEVLGNGRFLPLGADAPVEAEGPPPLVIITTNEERELPPAFLRRCWVLALALSRTRAGLERELGERARAHFQDIDAEALAQAAKLIADQRIDPHSGDEVVGPPPRPGVAELLDLLRAVREIAPNDPKRQRAALADIAEFALTKAGTVEP